MREERGDEKGEGDYESTGEEGRGRGERGVP